MIYYVSRILKKYSRISMFPEKNPVSERYEIPGTFFEKEKFQSVP